MTNSDKSFDTVDEDVWSIYEKDIEEIVVDSYSEEEIDDDMCIELQSKPLPKEKEYERRKNINMMYSAIQKILGGGDAEEPRVRILKKATAACKQLCQEELNLKYETELLLQTNWKLKRRMEKLQQKKKRKSTPATISRRLSGPQLSSPIKTSPIEKRSVSVDESKLVISPNIPTETSTSQATEESSKVPPSLLKNSKRKVKKRSGLSDEEKEFYKMEEKLEDLMHEIDALWNDVNNDEEEESKVALKTTGEEDHSDVIPVDDVKPSTLTNPIDVPKRKEIIKLTDINKLIEPELNPNKHKEEIKINKVSTLIGGESSLLNNMEMFKITNLNKLLDPVQNPIIKSCESSSFQNIVSLREKRRSSTSGDESPRLVIDENPQGHGHDDKNNLNQREMDVMEALQAVDTLCLSLVSDEPTTSESQPMVVKIAKPIEKPDIIAISDSEDETTNSDDVVCIE